MKITAIPQLYRNLRRWREILVVLRRYGLADWLSHFRKLPLRNLIKDAQGVPLTQYSREVRVRLALTELGPTFIKLGQILSARPDLVGPALAAELRLLHANVSPDPPEKVRITLAEELGERFQSEIVDLDDQPLATASIGQVHTGRLRDGSEVVIKVQRYRIEAKVLQDLDVLMGLAQLAERVEALAAWGPVELARQIIPMLRRELDFERELRNMQIFSEFFEDVEEIVIPEAVTELCTRRVLVMRRLDGINMDDWSETVATPQQRNRMARRMTRCYMEMLFDHGVFHADPHAGNLLALSGERLGILDFGQVGRIDDRLRETIESMLFAIASGDENLLMRLIKRAGKAPATVDDAALAVDISEYLSVYGRQGLGRFDMTGALNDLSEILHRHRIKLPSQSALLLKTLLSLEGTLAILHAEFDSLEVMRSFVRQAMLKRLHPMRRVRQARRIYMEAENFLEVAPDQVLLLMEQMRSGLFSVNLEHHRLSPSINRLVLGLLASALFVGASMQLAFKVPPLLFPEQTFWGLHQLSVFGVACAMLSVLVMLRLLFAIGRSGHLNRGNED